VTDGLSKTYMVGEKTIPIPEYETGNFWGDAGSLYTAPFAILFASSRNCPVAIP